MIETLLNVVKAHAAALDQTVAQPRFGIVVSVDPDIASAKVQLQPENVLSGWLPVLSPWIGNGWGMLCLPSPGSQVLVVCQEGAAEHGVIVGSAYSLASPPPPGGQVGEFLLSHSSGITLKLGNDGIVHISGPVNIQGSVTVSGSLSVEGDVSDAEGSLSRLRDHYDTHTHVDSRGGITSVSNLQD
jgi:phage baseplate assembly protein gpV